MVFIWSPNSIASWPFGQDQVQNPNSGSHCWLSLRITWTCFEQCRCLGLTVSTGPQRVLYHWVWKAVPLSWGSDGKNYWSRLLMFGSLFKLFLFPTNTLLCFKGSKKGLVNPNASAFADEEQKGNLQKWESFRNKTIYIKLFGKWFFPLLQISEGFWEQRAHTHTLSGRWVNRKEKIDFYCLLI